MGIKCILPIFLKDILVPFGFYLKGNLKEEQNYIILKIKTLLHMHIHQILNFIEIRLEQK